MNDTTFQGNGKVAYVPVVVNTKPTKLSNADRIRSMTDEKLALFIHNAEAQAAETELVSYVNEWLDWLKQEAN